jgi:predicted RNase H-like HicB family nuclease
MSKIKKASVRHRPLQLPVVVERDEDGVYVVECPVLEGCYTQGRTLDEALQNIREAIALVLESRSARRAATVNREFSLHTVTI